MSVIPPAERAEIERIANDAIKGEPLRVPSRRERELGALVLSLLRRLDEAESSSTGSDRK